VVYLSTVPQTLGEAEAAVNNALSTNWLRLPESISSDLFSRAISKKLRAGDVLFEAGDDGNGCYRLDRGVLKVTLRSRRDEERILALLTPGAVVGDLSMIDGLPRSASVIALSDCELCFVSRTTFSKCAERRPEIYKHLTSLLARRLRETDNTIAALAFLTWKGRVARALLEIAEGLGEQTESGEILIHKMFSQRELAAMAGVARENVSRVLGEWQRRKIVSHSDHTLQIHNKSVLRSEMEW
jgi:CRP/FNR family cyclic AMP-dependent transcriptional regulator